MNFVEKIFEFCRVLRCFRCYFAKIINKIFACLKEKNKIGKTLAFSQKQLSLFIFSAWFEKTCFRGMVFDDVFIELLL